MALFNSAPPPANLTDLMKMDWFDEKPPLMDPFADALEDTSLYSLSHIVELCEYIQKTKESVALEVRTPEPLPDMPHEPEGLSDAEMSLLFENSPWNQEYSLTIRQVQVIAKGLRQKAEDRWYWQRRGLLDEVLTLRRDIAKVKQEYEKLDQIFKRALLQHYTRQKMQRRKG